MKLFNDLHYLPMSCIVFPLCIIMSPVSFCPPIILPPPLGNRLMIYAIYPCPVKFCPHIILPLSFCPPCKSFNVHYFPMSHIILPPYHFAPYHFAPWKLFYDFYDCWDQIPRTCHVFTRLFTSNTPWYFLDFALPPGLILPPIIIPPENGLMI